MIDDHYLEQIKQYLANRVPDTQVYVIEYATHNKKYYLSDCVKHRAKAHATALWTPLFNEAFLFVTEQDAVEFKQQHLKLRNNIQVTSVQQFNLKSLINDISQMS
jgi:hypothetical protein